MKEECPVLKYLGKTLLAAKLDDFAFYILCFAPNDVPRALIGITQYLLLNWFAMIYIQMKRFTAIRRRKYDNVSIRIYE